MASYILVITSCLFLINIFVFIALERDYLKTRRELLTSHGRTVADVSIQSGVENNLILSTTVDSISSQVDSRILVLDKKGIVRVDSSDEMLGEDLSYVPEVKSALSGQKFRDKYNFQSKKVLYIAIPITTGKNIIGAVYISNSLQDIYNKIFAIQKSLLVISVLVLVTVGIFSFIMSEITTGPIKKVIGAIESMAEGNLKQRVEVIGNDEIASLSSAFNNMNDKINAMDKERRQFVADASHELKSPLASIKVLVQSLLTGGIDNREISLEFLENIDKEVDRLSNIVGNLLELTKLEGSYGMKVEVFDLNDLCKDVIKKLNPIAKTKNVEIRYEEKSIALEGNRENIFRAIYNIIENSVKYSNSNSFVDVWTESGAYAKLFIKDMGIGIPQDELNKIFERFYRVDKTRDRKTGGSGLGLSIAMEIIKRHKGEIQVKSSVGEGSLFIISIPYKYIQ